MHKKLKSFKVIIGFLSIAAGILSLIYFIGTLAVGVTFAKFFGFLGVLLIIYGFIKIFIDESYVMRKAGAVVRFMRVIVVILLISFIVIESFIISSGMKKSTKAVDYVVVLGAGLNGETPSLTLWGRLQDGLEYIKRHTNTKVVLSGGKGPGENITEAEAMRRFYVEHGIDEKLLIKEEKSTNTTENLKFTKEVLDKIDSKSDKTIMIVTSDFHIFRAKLLARRVGFTAFGYPTDIPTWLIPTYYIREYMAVVKSLVFDIGVSNAASVEAEKIGEELLMESTLLEVKESQLDGSGRFRG